MKLAIGFSFTVILCFGQLTIPPALNTGITGMMPAARYDAVLRYHASGSAATTTGTIPANTNSLSVASSATFSVGEGIYIAGAVSGTTQNPNGNLVTTITAISGTTFTLAANATVSVSGVTVQHDDTAAINNALADAFNNGGGTVWLRSTGVDGVYRCSGLANSGTGGILTLPQNLVYRGPTNVALVGESPNVALDFTTAPNISGNSAFSAAPYVAATSGNFTTIFEPVNVVVDNLNWGLPAQTNLNGLMFSNALQAKIGDNVNVAPAPDTPGVWNQPTGNSTGIWMPQAYNNVIVNLGSAHVAFFNHCVVPGEHTVFSNTYIYGCNAPLYMYGANHQIKGTMTIEGSPTLIMVDPAVAGAAPLDILIDGEGYGHGWQTRVQDLVDPHNKLAGIIAYQMFASGPGANGMTYLTRGGGALNVKLVNTQAIALYGASGFPIPACIADLQNDRETVYDATSPTYLGTYVSGGATVSPVICNGTNWVTY